MIKKLQQKFIIITMGSVLAVLGGLMSVINLANYISINRMADERLAVLTENEGRFPRQEEAPEKKPLPPGMSPEAPFETRYFTVILDSEGEAVSADTGRIAAISAETAKAYGFELYHKGKTEGFQGHYKYRAVHLDEGMMYIFLDCGRELSTFYSFLGMSILISLLGVLLVFLLVVFFSRRAVRPAAESYEKQKRFITDASHEIKTPLTIIDANTEVIELENGESEWTEGIKNQVRRLNLLTERLVFLSRMDEEHTVLQATDFSFSDAVAETAQSFETVAKGQGKQLQTEIQQGVTFCGDEGMLRQMVSLLLDNAIKYSGENGEIRLCFWRRERYTELVLYNTVPEISRGNLDRLFERFYRPDSSRNSETGGFGIGLSAVKAIVTAHKGKIHAESEDGRSIEFRVIF